MKYQIKRTRGEPDTLEIHVDQRLIRGTPLMIDPTDEPDLGLEYVKAQGFDSGEELSAFYHFVTELAGMQPVFIVERYCITIHKASLFSWDDLLPFILLALQEMVAKDHVLEEVLKSKKLKKDKRKAVEKDIVPKS